MRITLLFSIAMALIALGGAIPGWAAPNCAATAVAAAPGATFTGLRDQAVASAAALLSCMRATVGTIENLSEDERRQLREALQEIHAGWINGPADEEPYMPDERELKRPLFSITVSSGEPAADAQLLNLSLQQLMALMQFALTEARMVGGLIEAIGPVPPVGAMSSPNALRVPDPNLVPVISPSQRLADGRPIPPPNAKDEDRARQLVADQFERLVRIFMAGTEQLKRDFPPQAGAAPYAGPEIRGYYQGYLPDVLGTLATGRELPGQYDAKAAACGVANPQNRWFKSADGGLAESFGGGRVTNHRGECRNARLNEPVDFVRGRGRIAQQLLAMMDSIKSSILTGFVPAPGALGAPDTCRERREAIGVQALVPGARTEVLENDALTLASAANRRHYNYLIHRDLLRELKRDQVQQQLLECAIQAERTGRQQAADMEGSIKTLHRQQNRICLLASMQAIVETQLVAEYAYCVWRSAAQEQITRITNSLMKARRIDPTRGYASLACGGHPG